ISLFDAESSVRRGIRRRVEERPIIWAPHGTVGHRNPTARSPRAGWRRPLYGYVKASNPLTLQAINTTGEQAWVREWAASRAGQVLGTLPLQLYRGNLRGNQGYLKKMPLDFVQHWHKLSFLADQVAVTEEAIAPLSD